MDAMDRVERRGRSAASALLGAQALTAALAGGIAWIAGGPAAALAALFGGLAVLLPTVYFAAKVHFRAGGTAAELLGAFYRAEAGKLVLTMVMFGIGAKLFGQHFAPLMLTSVACIAMNWLIVALTRDW
jgi:ATP synthase protein I